MTAVAPMQSFNSSGIDLGRPGQQLLPGYVVKLLKTLKIPFGTERGMTGIDVDPTINLIGHVFECIGALREINKVYRAKGSLASRSIGTRVLFGLTSELGNILLDAITFDPPPELKDAAIYYSQISSNILTVFPEIASQVTPATGKVLLHQTALKTSSVMAIESLKMVIKTFPAAAWTPDKAGALPLHWITHNACCNQEMIGLLIAANPKGPWVVDHDGYLPLHWAVNQNFPNIDVVAALISANGSAAAKPCNKGSLPLHWCVNRERPHLGVLKALAQIHPDGVRTFDKNGWLPIHQCVNRGDISIDAMTALIDLYPQGLQCPNTNGQLPLHRALDQTNPSVEAIKIMLQVFPGAAKVADDEGYLPIHLALDCARPNPQIAQLLLEIFPESAFHKSKDGLLPLHCIISSMHPVIEIVQQLLEIFPDSSEIMAVDLMPLDETADPETWQGEWIEKRWTPLSRAIDRGLDSIVVLFRAALSANPQKTPMERMNSTTPQRLLPNSASATRIMQPQSKPPINNLAALQAASQHQLLQQNQSDPHLVGGPSTSSAEANRNRLVLGGNLDNEDDARLLDPEGGRNSRVLQSRPSGIPPPLKDRAPGGSVVGRAMSSQRNREKDRGESREKDRDRRKSSRRDHSESRDRDRDREREKERDRDRDRERERDRERSSHRHSHSHGQHRSSEEKRSASRKRDDRDRGRDSEGENGEDFYDEDRRYRSSRQKTSSSHRHQPNGSSSSHRQETADSAAAPYRVVSQGRLYEQTEYDEENVYPVAEGMENLNLSMKSRGVEESPYVNPDPRDLTNTYVATPKINETPSSAKATSHHRPQSAAPAATNSLLDAANARPFSRKGHSAGKQRRDDPNNSGQFRPELQHSRDANPEDYQPVAVNIRDSNSIDDMV